MKRIISNSFSWIKQKSIVYKRLLLNCTLWIIPMIPIWFVAYMFHGNNLTDKWWGLPVYITIIVITLLSLIFTVFSYFEVNDV
jgi:hypothetical protein